jgi:acyl-CoA synthetase (AMP-forming)/AMP-acid ligase II
MLYNDWLINKFIVFNNKNAIIFNEKVYTYNDLYQRIIYYIKILNVSAIEKGAIVAIKADYSFEAIALFFALKENKNIIVPIISTTSEEIIHRLDIVKAEYVFSYKNNEFSCVNLHKKNKKNILVNQLISTNKSGLILFSSGSTGKPKAMLHDLDNLTEGYKEKKQKDINTMIFLTFDHIGGIDTMLRLFSIGGTLTIPSSRQPEEVCRLIQEYRVNVLPSSPTFLNLLLLSKLNNKYDLSSLKIIAFGAEPMSESLLHRLTNLFPNIELQQKFGTSETNAIKIRGKSNNSLFFKIEDPNLEIKIVKDELWLKSKTQILGYLNATMENFTDDGWFKTGDLVEITKDGYIKIIGRNKEIINVGGEKVLPTEIESIILEMNEFSDVMVYGEKNPITGQRVTIDVVLTEILEKREIKKRIRKYCKNRLEQYKIPTKINIVDKTNYSERFKKIRRK